MAVWAVTNPSACWAQAQTKNPNQRLCFQLLTYHPLQKGWRWTNVAFRRQGMRTSPSIQDLLWSGGTCNSKRRKGTSLVFHGIAAEERQVPTAGFLRAHAKLKMLWQIFHPASASQRPKKNQNNKPQAYRQCWEMLPTPALTATWAWILLESAAGNADLEPFPILPSMTITSRPKPRDQ